MPGDAAHVEPEREHALARRLHGAIRHGRLGDERRRGVARAARDERPCGVRADLLVAGEEEAQRSARRGPARREQRERLHDERDAGLHVVDARSLRAAVVHAERLRGERAGGMHGVDVREHDEGREWRVGAGERREQVAAVAGRVEPLDRGAERDQLDLEPLGQADEGCLVRARRLVLDVRPHAVEHGRGGRRRAHPEPVLGPRGQRARFDHPLPSPWRR